MRVGVALGQFSPHHGGAYVFISEVFDAFLRLARSSNHQFVVFCDPAAVDALAAKSTTRNIQFCGVREGGTADKTIAALKTYSSMFALLWRRPGNVELAASKRGVELLWFVGDTTHRTPDLPFVATVWDVQHRTHPWFPEVSANGRWEFRELTRGRFFRRAAYIITGTEVGSEQLGWYYQVPKERIRILPHPTPVLAAEGTSSTPAFAARFVNPRFVFYPAQFWAHKNHVNLLHGLRVLEERHKVVVDVVFNGSDKGNLEHVKAVATNLGLTSRVHFLGFISTEELAWLYRNAAAMVYPSFSGPENLPPLEAFSQGCPVALSDYAGAREQVGDAACFFRPDDPVGMADTLKRVLDEPELRRHLIESGKDCAARRTTESFVKGVFSIFDEFETVRRTWR